MKPTGARCDTAGPWEDVADRVLVYSANYLDFDGRYSPGGRQRHIRDLVRAIQTWGREAVVVQKGRRPFEVVSPDGVHVIGLKADVTAAGDLSFANRARQIEKSGDVWLYASGEDAWPFFQQNSKAIQHGIWWDGPQRIHVRMVQRMRVLKMMRAVRTVLCVDTNFINWLRCQGREGYELCAKCHYVPNYVDVANLPTTTRRAGESLSIIAARRFEEKRGTMLLLDALSELRRRKIPFTGHICTVGGLDQLRSRAEYLGLSNAVGVTEESMDTVLSRYQNFHVSVVPTLWSEGTSLACVEAIAAGLPVVTTPVGGLGNLVFPGFNGFVVNPEAKSIADALERLTDGQTWEAMHQNCLGMRDGLDIRTWRDAVLRWLRA